MNIPQSFAELFAESNRSYPTEQDALCVQIYEFDAEAEKVAAARGQKVVLPGPNQLQIDIDSEQALSEFMRRLEAFNFELVSIEEIPSKTPGHYHIYLDFQGRPQPFTEWERLALQSALGDDPIRHFLNCLRAVSGVPNPTRLFEPLETP